MSAHIIRTDTEKERGMSSMSLQNIEQARHAITRTAERIDIYTQTDCDFRLCPVNHGRMG